MKVKVYVSEKGNKCLKKDAEIELSKETGNEELQVINIYDDVTFQTVIGFGGALTEAAAHTFYKMPKDKQEEIVKAYCSKKDGLGYNFFRIHMNSCDFSLDNWAYVEDGDKDLATFSVEHDENEIIPFIKRFLCEIGDDYKIFTSPWSPPSFMKTNEQMNFGGKLKKDYYKAWAEYYVKFIKAYKEKGINIWGVTVQNEPGAKQIWDSCLYTGYEEKEFVKNYLGPTLHRSGLSDVKIMIWDHNKERAYERAKIAFEDEVASNYIWGVALHWYSGDHFDALGYINRKWPDKELVLTEMCTKFPGEYGDWSLGERYAHEIIGDFKHGLSAWTDWNVILDEKGGPNHVSNFCNAPIICDTKVGALIYETPYFFVGHFSKFLTPGSVRIGLTIYTDKLEGIAFKKPTGEVIFIVLNKTEVNIKFTLRYKGNFFDYVINKHSIQTFVIS